ncbi:MAG: pentapeptide repeat-containing protein [Candidatus Pacearchaeota archaeon]
MVTQLIPMKGDELVKKILAGERDFSRIELEEGFNLADHESFEELQKYLTNANLDLDPIIMDNSKLRGVVARNLYLPFFRGKEANLWGADLLGADLSGADLWRACLSGADLSGAYLWRACLSGADLSGAYLWRADLWGADLWGADLSSAYLKNVKNLGKAVNLGHAIFYHTIVTEREKEIIERALKKKQLFIVEK